MNSTPFAARSPRILNAKPATSVVAGVKRAFLFLCALTAAHASDDRLLESIAQVEGHSWRHPGGRYALSYGAWSDLTDLPYRMASEPRIGLQMARNHLQRLRERLAAKGLAATPYVLAGCWRSGLARWTGGNAPRSHRDYALRVTNLYEEFTRLAAAVETPASSGPFRPILFQPTP